MIFDLVIVNFIYFHTLLKINPNLRIINKKLVFNPHYILGIPAGYYLYQIKNQAEFIN